MLNYRITVNEAVDRQPSGKTREEYFEYRITISEQGFKKFDEISQDLPCEISSKLLKSQILSVAFDIRYSKKHHAFSLPSTVHRLSSTEKNHSSRIASTGLEIAALTDCKLIVIKAINITAKPLAMVVHQGKSIP